MIRFLPFFKSKIIEITAIDSKGRTWILWYLRVKPLPHVFSFLIFLLNTNQVVCFCGLVHHDPFCRSTCSQASQQSFLYPSENSVAFSKEFVCISDNLRKQMNQRYFRNVHIQHVRTKLFIWSFFCMSYPFFAGQEAESQWTKIIAKKSHFRKPFLFTLISKQ